MKKQVTDNTVSFGPFRLIAIERLLMKDDEPVPLGGRALDILIALIERAGSVVGREELISCVWPDVTVEEVNLRVHIANLRKALGDGRDGARYIINVPGRGYCFVAPLQISAQGYPPSKAKPRPQAANTLPPRLQRMLGREELVKALAKKVATQRFVSIIGPGGMGKTTVAVAVAHLLASEFEDGVFFVDLSTLQDAALVIPTVAAAVGCLDQTQDSLTRLSTFLADKRLLLVLDCCEHVVDLVATLTERLFIEGPFVHIATTSREALRVEGENVHLLLPLDSPRSEVGLTAVGALEAPAVQLFMDRAVAGGFRHDLSDDTAPIVAEICRELDGIPLAIELVASRAGAYGIKGLMQIINDQLILLWRGRRGDPRHQTLQAMLDWSYNLLSEREQAVLMSLSVFVGTFTLEMAQTIVDDLDALQVADVITSLMDKCLISVSGSRDRGSYRLLDTTRTHAALKLADNDQQSEVARRHALYYAERLAGLRNNILQERDLSPFSSHVGDIRVALEWSYSVSGDTSVGIALGAGAVPLFLGLSMLGECRRWCQQTIVALGDDDRGTKLELNLQLAFAVSTIYSLGDTGDVGAALERGLSLADSMDDTESQLHFLAGLNIFRTRLADFGGALSAAERYDLSARKLGRPWEIVAAEWMLGTSHHLVGNLLLAQQSYDAGFARAAATRVREVHSYGYYHEVRSLIGYARTLWLRGFPDQAVQFARQGIEVADKRGNPATLCIGLLHVIPVLLWRDDQQVVQELTERLITCAAKHSLDPYHAGGLGMQGRLMLARGETTLGVETLRAATSMLERERPYILSYTFSQALAEGLARMGLVMEASDIIDTVIDEATRSSTFDLPDLLRAQAEVALALSPDNWPTAEASLLRAFNIARQQDAMGWLLRSAIALSRLWTDRGRLDQARQLLADAYGRFTEGYGTADLRDAERQLRTLEAALIVQAGSV